MRAIKAQIRVIWALILRETKTRYGRSRLGYPFVIIEPLLHISAFTALYSALDRRPPLGDSLFLFLGTGIIPFFLFRDLTINVMNSVTANRALLEYPPVKNIDVIMARICLELLTYGVIIAAFIPLCQGFELQIIPENPMRFMFGFFVIAGFGAGFGFIAASLSCLSIFVSKIVAWSLRVLYFLSGALFSVAHLPPDIKRLFDYNPLANAIEMIRSSFYFGFEYQAENQEQLLFIIVILFFLGFSFEFLLRRRMKLA